MLKRPERSLVWVAAMLTFAALAMLTGFFTLGAQIPITTDMNPGLYSQLAWHFPPRAWFNTDYWLGQMQMPQDFQPMSLLAHLPVWIYFCGYYPLFAALSLLAFYAFLREMGFRRGVAVLGGILYAWQGDLFSTLVAGHFSTVTVWFFFALAAFYAVRSAHRRDWFAAALCGVCTGIMVSLLPDRGGLCSLVIGGLFLVALWHKRAEKPELLRHAGRLGLVMVIAGAVALPGVWSTLSWTTIGAHQAGVQTPEDKYQWATQWSYTPEDALNYVIPGFFGWRNGSYSGPYWGRIGRSWQEPNTPQGRNLCLAIFTIGTVGFLLALAGAALVFPRWKKSASSKPAFLTEEQVDYARFALVAVVLGWLLALGKYGPLYQWFYHLPFMDTWRNPLKFLAPVSLVLILLAACGAQALSWLIQAGAETAAAKKRVVTLLRRILLALIVTWVFSFPARLPMTVYLDRLFFGSTEVDAILSTLRTSLLMAALVVGLMWWGWRRLTLPVEQRRQEFINPLIQKAWDAMMLPENLGRTWLALLAALVLMQMLWVQSHFSELVNFQAFYGQSALTKKLQPKDEVARVAIEPTDFMLHQALSTLFPYQGIQAIDIPAASRIPDDYADLFRTLANNRLRLQQLGGVKFWICSASSVSAIQEAPGFTDAIKSISYYTIDPRFVTGTPTHAIVELKNYLPKVSLVPAVEQFTESEDLLKRLGDEKWNPFATVLIQQEDVPAALAQTGTKGDAATAKLKPEAKLLHYDSRRIEVNVHSPVPSTLVISDRFDPGWRATLNGKPAPLFRADYILRGLSVPAGESTVVMTYSVPMTPHYVQLAVLLFVAAWALGRWFRRYPVVVSIQKPEQS